MSKHSSHGVEDGAHDHGAHTVRASKGGGGGKWLMAGVAALVLAGGGYMAWQNYAPQQPAQTDLAYNAYSEDPLRAGPLEPEQNLTADTAAVDESAAPPAAAPRAAPAAVPEETIGITPVSVTTDETDEIVVNPPQRPVWSRTPSQRRLTALYPERALERGREGEARLACTVQERGVLDCTPVSETPARSGFGNAAVRVAHTFRHAPTRADGSAAVGTPLNLRVVFRIDEDSRRG